MRKSPKKAHKVVPSYAVVVDGETEVWYLHMLKRNERAIRVSIKPEIPNKKSIEEQYNMVRELSGKEYTKVFWIIDLDTIIREEKEKPKGKKSPLELLEGFRNDLTAKYPGVVLIVNNPCLEFWFLLHFEKTARYYAACSGAETALKKHLKDYEKTQKFFTKQNDDIYLKLKPYLKTGLLNALALGDFDPVNPEKALCEMAHLFQSAALKPHFYT